MYDRWKYWNNDVTEMKDTFLGFSLFDAQILPQDSDFRKDLIV